MKKFYTLSFSLIFFACVLGIFVQCTSLSILGNCVDNIKYESVSPDRRFVATVFERSCGATTGFSTQVNIRESSQSFDSKSKGSILVTGGRNAIYLSWIDKSHLSVSLLNVEIFKKEEMWNGISITYIFGQGEGLSWWGVLARVGNAHPA
jgi:hypothetical protein